MSIGRHLLGRLPAPVAALLAELGSATASAGARLWLVGGPVRDLWLGEPSADLDLVVEGPLAPALAALAAAGHTVEPKGAAFHTYRLLPAAGRLGRLAEYSRVDLAAARRERYAQPAALPTVEPGSLETDLRRRDVSLNALAIALDPGRWGDLVDPTGGLPDLAAGRLRALHARTFEDDPTRAFRIARFAGRYGFEIEAATAGWMAAAVSAGLVGRLSGARVRAQIALLAAEPSPIGPLASHARLGLLAAVHPALAADPAASDRVAAGWEAAAALSALGVATGDPLGRLLRALLAGRPAAAAAAAVARLGLSGRPAARLAADAERLPALAAELTRRAGAMAPRALHDRLAPLDAAALPVVTALAGAAGRREVVRWAVELAGRRPRLTGLDLEALGVARGPAIGRLLDRLLTERLSGRLPSRADEEAFVRRLLADEGQGAEGNTT